MPERTKPKTAKYSSNSSNTNSKHVNNNFYLFHPKPYWHWAIEDISENGILTEKDYALSVDNGDESFIAYQIINLHLQKFPSDKVLYILPLGAAGD